LPFSRAEKQVGKDEGKALSSFDCYNTDVYLSESLEKENTVETRVQNLNDR